MKKYALRVDDPILRVELTLYFEKEDTLHIGDEIILKRSEVKSWPKQIKVINKLFSKRGKSEKIRDSIGNYEIKFKVGEGVGLRALVSVLEPYQAFNAHII